MNYKDISFLIIAVLLILNLIINIVKFIIEHFAIEEIEK